MLDRERIIKVELTSATEEKLILADKEQLSYPKMFINDMPADNIIIIKGRDFPTLKQNQSVFLTAYMKNGDRIRYSGSIRVSLPHQVNVQLSSDLGTVMPERRRYFKVDADLNCIVNGFTRADEEYEYEIPLVAVIRNISIGGIFLMCTNQKFSRDDTLFINFKTDAYSEPIRVEAKVLRLQRGADGGIEGYGCQFINTDPGLEEQFAKLVYDIQLKKRNEQMEREENRLDAKKW